MERLTHAVGAQVFCLYPQSIVIVGLFGVFSVRYGIRLSKQVQVYAAAHGLVALGIQVQPVVLEEELRLHGCGVLRITYGFVEIYNAVQHLCGANPLVNGGTSFLVVIRSIAAVLERSDGAAEDVDALLVSLADNLLIDLNNLLGCLHTIAGIAQVVDGFEQDNPTYALLT